MTNEKKSIIIVEDDLALRQMISDRLTDSCTILYAGDGEEAIAKIVDNTPDLILLDLMLPKLDGFKVLQRVRSYPDPAIADAHVLVLSNLWSQKDIIQAQGLKIDEYFVKAHTKMEVVISKILQILAITPQIENLTN